MSDDANSEQGANRHVTSPAIPYKRYLYIPPFVQHLMIAALGVLLAVASGYTLRKLGY